MNRIRYDWHEYAAAGWFCTFGVCAASWVALGLWGACLVLGLLAFGLALIAIAWEGLQR